MVPVELLMGSCPPVQTQSSPSLTDWYHPQKHQQISTLTKDRKACVSFYFCCFYSGRKNIKAAVWHSPYTSYALQRCRYVNPASCLTRHVSTLLGDQFNASTTHRQDNVCCFSQKLVTHLSCSE